MISLKAIWDKIQRYPIRRKIKAWCGIDPDKMRAVSDTWSLSKPLRCVRENFYRSDFIDHWYQVLAGERQVVSGTFGGHSLEGTGDKVYYAIHNTDNPDTIFVGLQVLHFASVKLIPRDKAEKAKMDLFAWLFDTFWWDVFFPYENYYYEVEDRLNRARCRAVYVSA